MGLIDKVMPKKDDSEKLSKEESEFILKKMRLSTYTGEEFEMFYKVFKKISEHIKTIK